MNDRQLKEIAFDLLYAKFFAHGTDGDNARRIMAAQATELGYRLEIHACVNPPFLSLIRNDAVVLTLPELP